MTEARYRVRNWRRFQHFANRRPPWVKLYRDLLDDMAWHRLDGDSAKVLVQLWLLASEDEDQTGLLPPVTEIAFRLRISESKAKQHVTRLGEWLEQVDIETISPGYQHDPPRALARDRDRDRDRDREDAQARDPLPDWLDCEAWDRWQRHRTEIRKPLKPTQAEAQIRKLDTLRADGHRPEDVIDHSIAGGWQGLFPPDKRGSNGHANGHHHRRTTGDMVREADEAARRAEAEEGSGHGPALATHGGNLR